MPFRLARVAWGSEALKKSSRREGQDGPEASGKACGGAGALSVVVKRLCMIGRPEEGRQWGGGGNNSARKWVLPRVSSYSCGAEVPTLWRVSSASHRELRLPRTPECSRVPSAPEAQDQSRLSLAPLLDRSDGFAS